MKYLENNRIKNEVIDKLIDELENYKDTEHYACDLWLDLLENYNMDGSITYSACKAYEWVKNNFDDLDEIVEEIQANGLEIPNVFDNPESFMVVIYLEVASYVMGRCDFISDNWDNTIVLNDININIIKKQLEELKDNEE